MPRSDGTGPPEGMRPGIGRSMVRDAGIGPPGHCICTKCGRTVTHKIGVPCSSIRCSRCGAVMVRKD